MARIRAEGRAGTRAVSKSAEKAAENLRRAYYAGKFDKAMARYMERKTPGQADALLEKGILKAEIEKACARDLERLKRLEMLVSEAHAYGENLRKFIAECEDPVRLRKKTTGELKQMQALFGMAAKNIKESLSELGKPVLAETGKKLGPLRRMQYKLITYSNRISAVLKERSENK